MSRRPASLLAVLAAAAVLAVVLLVPQQTSRNGAADAPLFPALGQSVNSADGLSVERSGQEPVRLKRERDRWVITSLQGYPADWERVRTLLADLARAVIVEYKTNNPAYYDRLGVDEPGSEEATGALLRLSVDGDETALIVGKRAAGRGGQYVRVAGEERSLLIDREFDLPAEAVGWADRTVADIGSGDVAEVEIVHPDGGRILIRKAAASDPDFQLVNLPEGRQTRSSWSVNSLAGGLSALTMDSVRPADASVPDDAVFVRLLTFGGVEYRAQLWAEDQERWIALRAAKHEMADAGDGESEAPAAAEADAFNRRVAGWWYRLPEYKYDALTKRLDDLLAAPEQGDGTGD